MANKRIDELDGLTTLGGSEQIAIVSSAATYHTTVAALKTHIVGGTNGLENRVADVEAKLSAQGTPGTVQAACKVLNGVIVEGSAFNVEKIDSMGITAFGNVQRITFKSEIAMPIPFVTTIGRQPYVTLIYEVTSTYCDIMSSNKGSDALNTYKAPSDFSFAVIGA
jgi:hypothetical protein